MAKDIGKHFKQTPIELTRKILARRHASSIQVDISRFLTTNIDRKKTDAGKLDIGLILGDIKQTLIEITRNIGKKTLELSLDRHQQILQTNFDRKERQK